MHAEILVPTTKTVSHPQYMLVARWMVNYCNRNASGRYDTIATHLRRSQVKAGGPALRLAQAVWDFHYRTLYPEDPKRIVEEQNSFAHLRDHHMVNLKKQYHVWQAMHDFAKLREYHYEDSVLNLIAQPPLETPHPLRAAMRHLDEKAHRSQRVSHHPLFRQVLQAISLSNPTDESFLLHTVETAELFADWRLDTTSSQAFEDFQKATNLVLNIRHRNRAYLEHNNPQLDLAIGLLGRCLRTPPS